MGIFENLFGKKKIRFGTVKGDTLDLIRGEWDQIEILLKGKKPSQLRQALIKADKTIDNALRDIVAGDSMGERLKNAKDKFDWPTYDKIWKAHKVRNKLVHESGFEPPYHMVIGAVEDLKKGIEKLGIRL